MLNLVLSLVGVMNNMKINQYQIHYIYIECGLMVLNTSIYQRFFFVQNFASL
jgi:hypothetical protein